MTIVDSYQRMNLVLSTAGTVGFAVAAVVHPGTRQANPPETLRVEHRLAVLLVAIARLAVFVGSAGSAGSAAVFGLLAFAAAPMEGAVVESVSALFEDQESAARLLAPAYAVRYPAQLLSHYPDQVDPVYWGPSAA